MWLLVVLELIRVIVGNKGGLLISTHVHSCDHLGKGDHLEHGASVNKQSRDVFDI